jgi:hypothetical protein
MTFDIVAAIRAACEDTDLRKAAMLALGEAMPRLAQGDFDDTILHVSDLGSCSSAVVQRIRGEQSPADWKVQRTRFDDGAIAGAYNAALAKVALEASVPGIRCELEPPCEYRGLAGHIDLAIFSEFEEGLPADVCSQIAEFKLSHYAGAPERPDEIRKTGDSNIHQVLQTIGYALARDAPIASVIPYCPSEPSWDKKSKRRVDPDYFMQYDYEPFGRGCKRIIDSTGREIEVVPQMTGPTWADLVNANVVRLQHSLSHGHACDHTQSWGARLCRATVCPRREREKEKSA